MDTLYLIGNGFDLHHNLRTKYCHFHKYLIENEPDLEAQLNKFFDFSFEDKLWSDFEIDLGTFKYDTFYSDSDFKIFTNRNIFSFDFQENAKERTTELVNRIKDAFYRWLSLVDIKNLTPILKLDTNSLFLTFNYTKLLEVIYGINSDNILHVHGALEDDIIFGHNQRMTVDPEFDENGNLKNLSFSKSNSLSMTPISDFYKPVIEIIKKNNQFFQNVSKIKNIFVLGHSINCVDYPYFQEIHKYAPTVNWNVSYYADNQRVDFNNKLISVGVDISHIHFFKL